jgi:hypothetical protein
MGNTQISVVVQGPDDDPQSLDDLTRRLQEELRLLPAAESVTRPAGGPAPDGSKGDLVTTIGALVITGAFSRAALKALVSLVAEWRQRAQARRVELTEGDDSLVVEGVSASDQKALIDAWLQRRSADDA